jgi:UbiA prenyltransferase family
MKNILLHLRLPFSFFLMPVYLFALSQTAFVDTAKACWVFVILHLLVFPSSNAYNSYHDKDEGSIGLLETPPPVTQSLLNTANTLDLLAIVLGFVFVSQLFTIYLIAYILVSRAYSSPLIRLKKYPILSWLVVCIFQGSLTYLAIYSSISTQSLSHSVIQSLSNSATQSLSHSVIQSLSNSATQLLNHSVTQSLICTSNLLAIYPLTQVYQHDEDARRGDMTMSRLLGIRGTFVNAFVWLGLSAAGYWCVLDSTQFLLLSAFMLPVMLFLTAWIVKVWKDEGQANFKMTMWLNILASFCLNIFFGILYFINH